MCVPLVQLTETFEKAEETLILEELSGGVLAGLCGAKRLASFAKLVKERVCVGAGYLFVKGMCGWRL